MTQNEMQAADDIRLRPTTPLDGPVRDTITRLVRAYGANDLDTYFSFFADDMTVWWNTDGRYDRPTPKAAYVKLARVREEDRWP